MHNLKTFIIVILMLNDQKLSYNYAVSILSAIILPSEKFPIIFAQIPKLISFQAFPI